MRFRCRCVWGERCPNDATQEDGLCDWCGTRTPEQKRANPNAIFHAVTGEYLGQGGGGEAHVDPTRTPDACWMPNSGRTLAASGSHDTTGDDDGRDDERTIWCDAEGCFDWVTLNQHDSEHTVAGARRAAARLYGWTRCGRLDLCREHSARTGGAATGDGT